MIERVNRCPREFVLAIAALLAGGGACGRSDKTPTEAVFARATEAYLAQRGDLCLAKNVWPIDLTEREFEVHARDAVQLPVMERLGLVHASPAEVKLETPRGPTLAPVRRYQLTDAGRRYYLVRGKGAIAPGQEVRGGDLCAAKLSLDKVVGWELSKQDAGHAVVNYTYRVDPAPWTSDPEIRRVFPAVDRVIRGAGRAQLTEGFTLTGAGWIANELLPAAVPAAAPTGQLAAGQP